MGGIERKLFNNAGKLFLSLVELGEAPSSQWHQLTGISHSSFHSARNHLLDLGVVEICETQGRSGRRTKTYRISRLAQSEVIDVIDNTLKKVGTEWAS